MEGTCLLALPEGMLIDQIETHRKRSGHLSRRYGSHIVLSVVFSALIIDPLELTPDLT